MVTRPSVSQAPIDISREFTDNGSVRKTHFRSPPLSLVTYLFLGLAAALAIGAGFAGAEGETPERPANSHPRPYGSGWECDRGYAEADRACAAVQVPLHAFLDSDGDGWECIRGYREVEGTCEAVQVPPNARLDFTGHRWECARGFKKVELECVALEVPPECLSEQFRGRMGMRPRLPGGQGGMCGARRTRERLPGLERARLGMRARLRESPLVLRGHQDPHERPSRRQRKPLQVRPGIPSKRRDLPARRDTLGGLSRALGERIRVQSRLSEERRKLRAGRRASERLPEALGRRMELRPRLPEARCHLRRLRGPDECPRHFLRQRPGIAIRATGDPGVPAAQATSKRSPSLLWRPGGRYSRMGRRARTTATLRDPPLGAPLRNLAHARRYLSEHRID